MSVIASIPERVKVNIPCGVLNGKSGIVGRYAKIRGGSRHSRGWTVYECLICGQEDFETAEALIEHCKTEHPES